MARPTIVSDQEADEIDEELLPGSPEPEADLRATGPVNADALRGEVERSLIEEEVNPTVDSDAWVEGQESEGATVEVVIDDRKPRRRRAPRKPPANLGASVADWPVHLKLISLGRGVANVSVTLGFEFDSPPDGIVDLMGEHAYAAVFRGDYLGNGLVLREAPLKVDVENSVKQALKVTIPRFDQGADQVPSYITPLLPEDVDLSTLLALSLSWRLNISVDFPGLLTLHAMQESFDLTGSAARDGANEPV